jgi:hypothetical protein
VDAERAAAYGREVGLTPRPDGSAPLCYPAIWLTAPDIHAAIARVCAEADSVPVHESQSFAYDSPLRIGQSYDLSLTLRREATPPRLVIQAVVAALGGEAMARIETMLRLVPRGGFGAEAGA